MLFEQKNTPTQTSNLTFRESHLWPEDVEQLSLMLFHRTFETQTKIDLTSASKKFAPLFYTFTDQLVECHHLSELERHFDRKLLLSRVVSDKDTDMAALVTKMPFYKNKQLVQFLHLIFVEQRDNNWFLCIEEPDWTKTPQPENWKSTIEGFNTRSSKNKDPKPIGLGNWFSKSRFFDLSPLPIFSSTSEFQ